MEQGPSNPFSIDVYVEHPSALPGVSRIHHEAFNRIVAAVERDAARTEKKSLADCIGRTVLVTSPRAGYGKTHLSARLRHHLESLATVLELPLDPSRPVSWPVIQAAVLRQFCGKVPGTEGNRTILEETGRRLLARVVLAYLEAHEGGNPECPVDGETLRTRPIETFSESDRASELLSWMETRSRALVVDADDAFPASLGLSRKELVFWTRLLLDFHRRGEAALDPLRGLTSGEARERLLQWLRIASSFRPTLVIADRLDGFFRSESAGMEIAGVVTGIRESVPGSTTLVCLNEDLWESVFEDRIPSAWIDRLTGNTEALAPIDPEQACQLLRARLDSAGVETADAERFLETLQEAHRWSEGESELYPRLVLRQARDLWEADSAIYLRRGEDEPGAMEREIAETPLSELTDKVEFFTALQEGSLPTSVPREESLEEKTAPEPEQEQVSLPEPDLGPILPPPPVPKPEAKPPAEPGRRPGFPARTTPERKPDFPANPFFAPPKERESLAGIDSIIADIRGTGSTVRSEFAEGEENRESQVASAFRAGLLNLKPTGGHPADAPTPSLAPKPESAAGTRDPSEPVDFASLLRKREAEFEQADSPRLDFEKVERLVRTVGSRHRGLSQTEERFPSSRTVCARWQVRGQSVLVGFESPKNVYFWNNLLQQSLASSRREKIAAFSHSSEPFDPTVFSSFGFSPNISSKHIDIIEMNDRELAMVLAGDEVVEQFRGTADEDAAIDAVMLRLDPLWRRISRPL